MQDDISVGQVDESIAYKLLGAGQAWTLGKVSWVLELPGLQYGAQSPRGRQARQSGARPHLLP